MGRWLAAALSAATIVGVTAACGRVASVFLDLPQEPAEQAPSTARRAVPASADSAPPSQATQVARPVIEGTLRRDSALALLPRDNAGNVDWVTALRTGVVRPRTGVPGGESPGIPAFRFDFLFKGQVPMFDAYFPHSAHVEWLDCRTCHPGIFRYRNTPIGMEAINRGEACGRCHGKVAFGVPTCERCHRDMAMPAGRLQPTLIDDIVLARRADTAGATPGRDAYQPATFPHWVHRVRYRCMACHPALFEAQAGADTLTMAEMRRRQSCGVCHNERDAFGLMECERCHVPQPRAARPDSAR